MSLFIIVICLLSERFLVHSISFKRFCWFPTYFRAIAQQLPTEGPVSHPAVVLIAVLLPLLLVYSVLILVLGHFFFGFIGFLLNLIVFYYCLGPENPFYPSRSEDESEESAVNRYLAKINSELFAVIFWYMLAGPIALLFYRLLALCQQMERTACLAQTLTGLVDWLPARLTVLLYLFAGNFQQGWSFFLQNFLTKPQNNELLLNGGGLLAVRENSNEPITLSQTESLVIHATLIFLVLIALYTIISWV